MKRKFRFWFILVLILSFNRAHASDPPRLRISLRFYYAQGYVKPFFESYFTEELLKIPDIQLVPGDSEINISVHSQYERKDEIGRGRVWSIALIVTSYVKAEKIPTWLLYNGASTDLVLKFRLQNPPQLEWIWSSCEDWQEQDLQKNVTDFVKLLNEGLLSDQRSALKDWYEMDQAIGQKSKDTFHPWR